MSGIPDELLAEMTPGVRTLVEMLVARCARLEERVAALEVQLDKTSKNSVGHTSARQTRTTVETQFETKTGRPAGSSEI